MTSHALAASAYSGVARTLGTPRDVEYQALQRITAMLTAATQPGAAFARVAEAIHMNNRLWTMLSNDLAADSNGLSEDLRVRLLGLATFARRQGRDVLTKKKAVEDGLADLIEINTSIMRGLKGESGQAPNGG